MPIAGRKKRSSKLPVVLVAPALVLLALFTFAPAGYAAYLSLMKLHVTGGLLGTSSTQVFAGLGNYADTFHDPEFWHSLGRMLLIAVIGVPSTVILATVFALYLDANAARLTTVTRLAIFLPYAVPGVIASMTNSYESVLLPQLVSPFAIYLCKIYAEAAVPDELMEAVRIDGGSELRIFWSVGTRLMLPVLVTVLLLQFIAVWNNFLLPFVMLNNNTLYPLTLGLYGMLMPTGGQPNQYSLVIGGVFLTIVPLAILFLSLQRFWRIDLISGGVKG